MLTPQILVNALDAGEAHFSQIALLVSAARTAVLAGTAGVGSVGGRLPAVQYPAFAARACGAARRGAGLCPPLHQQGTVASLEGSSPTSLPMNLHDLLQVLESGTTPRRCFTAQMRGPWL